MQDSEEFKEAVEAWRSITERYGEHKRVDNLDVLDEIDPRRIWTEYWRDDQYITNEFFRVEELDAEVTSYYVFERPYIEPEGTIYLTTTLWEECDCGGDNAECEDCQGFSSKSIDVM